jgi:hypothetical protein
LPLGKFFRLPAVFLERENEKKRRFFKLSFRCSTCTKFSMLWKWSEKSLWVFFLLVSFHFHLILEFSDFRFGSYWRFSGKYVFQRGVPRQIWKLIFLILFIHWRRLMMKNLEKIYFPLLFFPNFCEKPLL